MDSSIQHAFWGYEHILQKYAYPLYVTDLFQEEDIDTLTAFLEQLEFDNQNLSFTQFKYQFKFFKAAYINNDLPI
ncbi:MAG: hypothetical protein ACI35P_02715 [Bacillus sp. (in: firmicutes)]